MIGRCSNRLVQTVLSCGPSASDAVLAVCYQVARPQLLIKAAVYPSAVALKAAFIVAPPSSNPPDAT